MKCIAYEKICNACSSILCFRIVPSRILGTGDVIFYMYFNWCDKCKVDCQSYTTRVCDGELEKQGGIFVCEKCGYSYTSEFVMNQIKIVSIIEGFSGVG